MYDKELVGMYLRHAKMFMVMAMNHKIRYKATGNNVHRLFFNDSVKHMEEAVAMAEMYLMGPVIR